MKKFLSLVLALVMTMSLVTISAGAEDFTDAEDIKYVEAVDVLSAIGVINGNPDGSFNPKGALTRAQAAKIICALNLTPDVAAELVADAAPFADVAADHWAAGYIAEGVASGILNGVGGGLFAPDAELTGFAFAKMLLVSLGYDAAAEKMVGDNWSINVAKVAKKAGLTAGITGFAGAKAITREVAAKMALNALEADLVEYEENGSSITIGNVVISTDKGKAEAVTDEKGKEVTFMAENYAKLSKKTNGEDALGRPATEWKYDGEKVGLYAETADYTFVLDETVADLAKYLDEEEILEDAEIDEDTEFAYNGAEALTYGSVVEVFADDEYVENVVVVNYTLGKVTKVDDSMTKKELKDGHEAEITVTTNWDDDEKKDSVKVYDDEFAGFDYEKNDYILFVYADGEIVASELAETFEGEITATKKGNQVKIDGEWYDDLTKTLDEEDEATLFLNAAGQIIKAVAVEDEESEDYAYIYNYKSLDGEENDDGVKLDGVEKVWAVLADGTKETYLVAEKTKVAAKDAKGTVVTYSINDDDELVIEKSFALEELTISKSTKKVDGAYMLSTTEFVFVEYDADDKVYEVETVTGYKNVKVTDEAAYIVTNDDDEATLVFVVAGNGKVAADEVEYTVLLEEGYIERTKNDDDKYEYTVATSSDDMIFDAASYAEIKDADAGAVISYVLEDGVATNAKVVAVTGEVESVNDEYYYVDGEAYEYDEEEIITITYVYDEDGKFDCVEVDEGGELSEDAEVVMIFDEDKVETIYVYEVDE